MSRVTIEDLWKLNEAIGATMVAAEKVLNEGEGGTRALDLAAATLESVDVAWDIVVKLWEAECASRGLDKDAEYERCLKLYGLTQT